MRNEHHRSLILFSSLYALARALPTVVGAWFPVFSFKFPALVSSARTAPFLVASWFRIQHRISSSFIRAFALLKMFPKHSPSLGHFLFYHFARFATSNCVVRWVVAITLAVVLCFSCVALLCIHCWLRALVQTCFAHSCFFQKFFNEISLIRHSLVSTLQ